MQRTLVELELEVDRVRPTAAEGDPVPAAVADAAVATVATAPAVGLASVLVSGGQTLAGSGGNAGRAAVDLTIVQQAQVARAVAQLLLERATSDPQRRAAVRPARPRVRARKKCSSPTRTRRVHHP